MEWSMAALLVGAGALGGVINALAGGATLITFPAMVAAGLPPVIANASSAVAISPGHILAALADRENLPAPDRRFWLLSIAATAGGALGAFILLAIPPAYFILPVPALIAFATLLFAFAPQVQAWSARRRGGQAQDGPARGLLPIALASVYGGFFGAGLGVILTAVISITDPGNLRAIKSLKNLLATFVTAAAIVIFIAQGSVHWPATLCMLAGALAGGYLGGHLIRVLPASAIRAFVIVTGAVMTVIYATKYWF
ncbi:sulfite exporter TauE/SafE family protein [Achromobacter xylosoxidans]|uniref:Probable membrane transporter protein n=2 Tax=Alcaligenaceae TaxID=506 RepID=A0A0X8NWV2_ALCXX|nr:sulfite exporter TauE/SafE family protein [Achromobacter xylosoxidans]